jgi:PAS domain S-box-containing protein
MNSHADALGEILIAAEDRFPVEELFAAAKAAVLVADSATGRTIAINTAALRLLGKTRTELVGRNWYQAFSVRSAQALEGAANRAIASSATIHATASAVIGGSIIAVTLSTFRVSKVTYLLVHLVPEEAVEAPSKSISIDVFAQLDAVSVCFVVTDGALCIEFGNKAFLEILDQPANAQIAGQSLLRWVSLTQADLSRMHMQMLAREACAVLTAVLCSGPNAGTTFEIEAIAVPHEFTPHWGFVLHRIAWQ